MDLLCPCLKSNRKSNRSETELTSQNNRGGVGNTNDTNISLSSLYSISKSMSSATIKTRGLNVKGSGLALVDVSIEQDCAYWEWHVETSSSGTSSKGGFEDEEEDDFFSQGVTMNFGVAHASDHSKLHENQDNDGGGGGSNPTDNVPLLMKTITNLRNGDTIGVAVQQDDLPMIQFLLNGEPLHDLNISRFRGVVYPSVLLVGDDNDGKNNTGKLDNVKFVWKEEEFQEMSPSVRFKPLMAAISIV